MLGARTRMGRPSASAVRVAAERFDPSGHLLVPGNGSSRYLLAMIDEATIVEAGRRISAAAPEAQVILFGSHARDDANPGSDLDLLVIEPEVENAAMESVRLHRTLRGLGVPADVVVVDEDLARRRSRVAGTMVERALREGRVLVDA